MVAFLRNQVRNYQSVTATKVSADDINRGRSSTSPFSSFLSGWHPWPGNCCNILYYGCSQQGLAWTLAFSGLIMVAHCTTTIPKLLGTDRPTIGTTWFYWLSLCNSPSSIYINRKLMQWICVPSLMGDGPSWLICTTLRCTLLWEMLVNMALG